MEFHERMGIAHALHTFWNPVSVEHVDELLSAMDLQSGTRVLDVACGAGELLIRMAARHGISGVGVDISSWALERARAALAERAPDAAVEFVEMEGKDYRPADGRAFDVVSLVGASWIWQGSRGTITALHDLVRPGGLVLLGEPFWKVADLPAADLDADGMKPDDYFDLPGLHAAVVDAGFRLLYQVVSSPQDWDRYEMLRSLAVDRWAIAHAGHPDLDEILGLQEREQRTYFKWQRDTLGFTQMILRRVE